MIVGIDVRKRTHAVALLDERGGEVATTAVANSPEGFRRLIGWLSDHEAGEAIVGVESPGSYGRCLVGALAAAGHDVLHVPAWRTHRERHRQGPGKTDPGDAISIAQVVLRKREELGPALEPELVRALSTLELQRRRFVRDRTQAIQRLRADWTQVDPVAEGRVLRLDRDRELRGLKRISFGDGLAEQTAARCIRELARDVEDLNRRIAALDAEIAQLLAEHENPLEELHGAGTNLAATVIAQAGDVSALQERRRLRPLLRGGTDPLRVRPDLRAPPPAPGRQPPDERCPLSDRDRPGPRHHPEAKRYLARKIAEGKTKREARRALKRHLANVIYRRLLACAEQAPAMNLLT